MAANDPNYSSTVKMWIFRPPCGCAVCSHGFYRPEIQYHPRFWYRGVNGLSDQSAGRILAMFTRGMEEDRQHLLLRLHSHVDIVMSRWKKKSQDKRRALLKEVAPDLEEHRWVAPRFVYMPESRAKEITIRRAPWRRQQLLPWLNVEALKPDPRALWALLHYRTAYHPRDWAHYDSSQLGLTWLGGWCDVQFSKKCVIMYGEHYGKLVDWSEGPAHRGDILGFPRARLMLEAQAYLLIFLRMVVDKLLEDSGESQVPKKEKWRYLTTYGFKWTGELELWSNYTNQAFSAPPAFSIDYLLLASEKSSRV